MFKIGDKVKIKLSGSTHGLVGTVSGFAFTNLVLVDFPGTAWKPGLTSCPYYEFELEPADEVPRPAFITLDDLCSPVKTVHACKSNLERYTGLMRVFDYCRVCDAKFNLDGSKR